MRQPVTISTKVRRPLAGSVKRVVENFDDDDAGANATCSTIGSILVNSGVTTHRDGERKREEEHERAMRKPFASSFDNTNCSFERLSDSLLLRT